MVPTPRDALPRQTAGPLFSQPPDLAGSAESKHTVELAVSRLGSIGGVAAFHSSVLIDGEEFCFSGTAGITVGRSTASHEPLGTRPRVVNVGSTLRTGGELLAVLAPHFEPGTYDLLRKNCNTFSDCALYFLIQRRLHSRYVKLERLGSMLPAVVQLVSGGLYERNPLADDFCTEKLISSIRPASERVGIGNSDAEVTVATCTLWGGGSTGTMRGWSEALHFMCQAPPPRHQACFPSCLHSVASQREEVDAREGPRTDHVHQEEPMAAATKSPVGHEASLAERLETVQVFVPHGITVTSQPMRRTDNYSTISDEQLAQWLQAEEQLCAESNLDRTWQANELCVDGSFERTPQAWEEKSWHVDEVEHQSRPRWVGSMRARPL